MTALAGLLIIVSAEQGSSLNLLYLLKCFATVVTVVVVVVVVNVVDDIVFIFVAWEIFNRRVNCRALPRYFRKMTLKRIRKNVSLIT